MGWLYYPIMVLFLLVCLILILLILIQKGRGGGLASAFGGAGGNTAFGSKTGDVLTWATSVVFGVFLIFAIALNVLANHRTAPVDVETEAPMTPPATGLPPAVAGDSPKTEPEKIEGPQTLESAGPSTQPSTPAIEAGAPTTAPANPG